MKKLALILIMMTANLVSSQTITPTITVYGKGTVRVVPDRVSISVLVETEGQTPTKAKMNNDSSVRKVISYLETEKINKSDYSTEEVSLRKEVSYRNNVETKQFVARQYLNILLKDVNMYDRIIVGLLEAGITDINEVNFDYSSKEEYESKARVKAVEDAMNKANEYAKATNSKVGKVIIISENMSGDNEGFQIYRNNMMMEKSVMGSAGGSTIAVGEREIVKNIKLVLELK